MTATMLSAQEVSAMMPPQTRPPGVYQDLPEADYFADPALSQSGMKLLLPPSTPAIFRHRQLHAEKSTTAFLIGAAVHKKVLGRGADIVELPVESYNTKAAQTGRDAALAAGKIPLKISEARQARQMADAVRLHPTAAALLAFGEPEVSVFWVDPATGLAMKARLDWLRIEPLTGQVDVADFKTAIGASGPAFAKAVLNYGYHQQHAHYTQGLQHALGLAEEPAFRFIVQEKTAPYLVQVFELDPAMLATGRALNRQAAEIYRSCLDSDVWPGYSDEVQQVSLPPWYSGAAIEAAGVDDVSGGDLF